MKSAGRSDRSDPPGGVIAAVVALAVAFGVFQSLHGSGAFLLYGDEFHSLRYLDRPYGALFGFYGINGSGGALLLLQRAAIDVFGPGLRAFRAPAILGAIGSLLLMYPAGARLVGRTPAAIATVALATNSVHVFYSRFGRTYALAVFLGLCLVYTLIRATDRPRTGAGWYAAVALCAGLLPYVHLTALAFTAAVAAAAFAALPRCDRLGRPGRSLAAAFVAGAVLCLALYLPAWEFVWQFIVLKSGRGDLSEILSIDAAELFAGSRAAGVVCLLGAPAAAVWIAVRKRRGSVVLLAATFAMPLALLVSRPIGDAYATARYLLVGLPFLLLLLAWAIAAAVRALGPAGRVSGCAALAVGVLAVAGAFAAGPLGFRHVDDGPFAASYLSLMPLPAFDAPWRGGSPFYESLAREAEPLRIVEAPALEDQAVALYRNYYLQHRKPVAIGAVTRNIPADPRGLHRPISGLDATNADYLILHLDVARELSRYWKFVYDGPRRSAAKSRLDAFMAFHEPRYVRPPPSLGTLLPDLTQRLGEPVHRDEDIAVWRLGPRRR